MVLSCMNKGFNVAWKKGSLRIIYRVSKFLEYLKSLASGYKFRFITTKMLRLIND